MNVEWIKLFCFEHAVATQLIFYVCVVSGIWLTEAIISNQLWSKKWQHTSVNSLFILSALPIEIFMSLLISSLSIWTLKKHWGLIHYFPQGGGLWLKYLLLFLVFDLVEYVYHRMMHGVAEFWPFHLVHHSDLSMDVSTTLREHPGETFLRNGFLLLAVFLFGAPLKFLLWRQLFQSLSNILSHTEIHFPHKVESLLRWVFVTPTSHRVHHHYLLPYTDSNFGDILCVWDRLLGTYRELQSSQIIYGVDTHMEEAQDAGFLRLMSMPFKKPKYDAAQIVKV